MAIHINPDLERQLEKIAKKSELSPDVLISGILESYLDEEFDGWETLDDIEANNKIKRGLDDLDSGKSSNFDESTIKEIHAHGLKNLNSRNDV